MFVSTDYGTQITEMYAAERGFDRIQGKIGIRYWQKELCMFICLIVAFFGR